MFRLIPSLTTLLCLFHRGSAASGSCPSLPRSVDPDDWATQCLSAFALGGGFVNPYGSDILVSNYDLKEMPSGLCADWLTCAFENCKWTPAINQALKHFNPGVDNLTTLINAGARLNLPASTADPTSAADVVRLVKMAASNQMPISVKTSGHSYAGSSSQKDSLMINLRRYPKYSQMSMIQALAQGKLVKKGSKLVYTKGALPSAIWCDMLSEDLQTASCMLAKARGKPATLRVGGGETWDDAYRAVETANFYFKTYFGGTVEIVGGGAGTVGAAGGWLQGGGLSIGDERRWGFGADQVLEIEMVLPDASHIKFGPVAWNKAEGHMYPRTTKVDGHCNKNVDEDESKWVWEKCDQPVPFEDLWFAVRGGGGGSYGIVTAVTYQLHPRREVEFVAYNTTLHSYVVEFCYNSLGNLKQECKDMQDQFIDFFVDLLFNPTAIGLDSSTSVNCGSSNIQLGFRDFNKGALFCHDGSAKQVMQAYSNFAKKMKLSSALSTHLAPVKQYWLSPFEVETSRSYAAFLLALNTKADYIPAPVGNLYDAPHPEVDSQGRDCWSALVPVGFLLQKDDAVHALMASGDAHVLGGLASEAGDQMNAISATQRQAGLQKHICGDSFMAQMLPLFQQHWPKPSTPYSLVAGVEFNHIAPDEFGPLRANASIPCPANYSHDDREEKCFSLQEFVWGTEGIARLEQIKAAVDPQHLFNCQKCVGYRADRQAYIV